MLGNVTAAATLSHLNGNSGAKICPGIIEPRVKMEIEWNRMEVENKWGQKFSK